MHQRAGSQSLIFYFVDLPEELFDVKASWRTRNVKVLSAVSFAQDTASDMLYPILPIFLSTILGAPASAIGAIEGVAEGAAASIKLIAGKISDRIPRRPRQKFRFVEVEQGLAVSAAKINATGKFKNCVNQVNLRSHSSSNCGAA